MLEPDLLGFVSLPSPTLQERAVQRSRFDSLPVICRVAWAIAQA